MRILEVIGICVAALFAVLLAIFIRRRLLMAGGGTIRLQVRVKLAGGEQLTYDVTGGFLSIDVDGVTVLAESATPATPDAH
jgi:hypothetical protein